MCWTSSVSASAKYLVRALVAGAADRGGVPPRAPARRAGGEQQRDGRGASHVAARLRLLCSCALAGLQC